MRLIRLLQRWPLRITALSTTLLLALPAGLLLLVPRRSATGLDRLLPDAALLQSFAVQPGQSVPPLWRQRLGAAEAERLWASQRRLWWQFWGPHGDAGAYLVLAAPPGLPLPPLSLRVDDLIVVAPSPLARQLLQEQLKLRRRLPRGLEQRCSQTLRQQEAVHWNGIALAQMLGPLAPLAQSLQQGCLELRSEGAALLWQGEADATAGALAAAPPPLPFTAAAPLSSRTLLELRGQRLELLLRGLTSSALLREALAQRYGLGEVQLRQLQDLPFTLELQPIANGPFRAGLLLQLELPPQRRPWELMLRELSRGLQAQGLSSTQPLPSLTSWSREDGTVVGGWRWLSARRLLLFLGPVPTAVAAEQPLAVMEWQLLLRPTALAASQLLPDGLPLVVQRASQLQLQGRSRGDRSGERQSALVGRLQLR